jgi:Kip1 ubiquitination-promoting complex protein 1
MVGSLLASFDNRFWIPISNILLRVCKGSGFGASKYSSHGESISPHFEVGEIPGSSSADEVEIVLVKCM